MIDFGVELLLILTSYGGAAQQESPLVMLMPMVVIGLIIYFLLVRPMRKRQKNNDINAAFAAAHETNVQVKKEVHQEQTDIEQRLLRLDSLLHSGLITEEEHKVKREKIIDKL